MNKNRAVYNRLLCNGSVLFIYETLENFSPRYTRTGFPRTKRLCSIQAALIERLISTGLKVVNWFDDFVDGYGLCDCILYFIYASVGKRSLV